MVTTEQRNNNILLVNQLRNEGLSTEEIAERLQVSTRTIYKYLNREPKVTYNTGKISEYENMQEDRNNGMSLEEIRQKYGVCRTTVYKALKK